MQIYGQESGFSQMTDYNHHRVQTVQIFASMDADSDENDIWNYTTVGKETIHINKASKQETASSRISVKHRKRSNSGRKKTCTTKTRSTIEGQHKQGTCHGDASVDIKNQKEDEELIDVDAEDESLYLPLDKNRKNGHTSNEIKKKFARHTPVMSVASAKSHLGHCKLPSHTSCCTSRTVSSAASPGKCQSLQSPGIHHTSRTVSSAATSPGKCQSLQSPSIHTYFSPSGEKRNIKRTSSNSVKSLCTDFSDDELLFVQEDRGANKQMKLRESVAGDYVCNTSSLATVDCSKDGDNSGHSVSPTQDQEAVHMHCTEVRYDKPTAVKERFVLSTNTITAEHHVGMFDGSTSHLAACLGSGCDSCVDKPQHGLMPSGDKLTCSRFVTSGNGFLLDAAGCDLIDNVGHCTFRDRCDLQTSSSSGEISDYSLTAAAECDVHSPLVDMSDLVKCNSLSDRNIAEAAAIEDQAVMKGRPGVPALADAADKHSLLSGVHKQTSIVSFFKARVGSSCSKLSALSDVTRRQTLPGSHSKASVRPTLNPCRTLSVVTPVKKHNSFRQHVIASTSAAAVETEPEVGQGSQQQHHARNKRQCPFYKKIHNTGITVDAFSYGVVPGCQAYILTHFHYDHYGGLTKKFAQPIYCSQITGNLVEHRLGVNNKWIHRLQLWIPYQVAGVTVTLMEANHCPGAVMVWFELKDGRTILHTGDFRACPEMETYPTLKRAVTTDVYLDTTYCNPSYTFPIQHDVINFVVSLVLTYVTRNPNTLIICGAYTIGKEKIFKAIAEALDSKICVTRDKKKVLDCLDDTALQARVTLDWSQGQVHVLPMGKLNQKALFEHHAGHPRFTSVLALEPTGWTHSNQVSLENLTPKWSRNSVTLYGIPYSEHSSYLELKRFIQFLQPQRIIPTVNNGNPAARKKMEDMFSSWKRERLANHGTLMATSQGI